jgi:hypothetical protein
VSTLPQLPRSGNPSRTPRNPGPWIDLIAFAVAILVISSVLLASGRTAAASLATICAALGSLYAEWRRLRSSREARPRDEQDEESDKHDR